MTSYIPATQPTTALSFKLDNHGAPVIRQTPVIGWEMRHGVPIPITLAGDADDYTFLFIDGRVADAAGNLISLDDVHAFIGRKTLERAKRDGRVLPPGTLPLHLGQRNA